MRKIVAILFFGVALVLHPCMGNAGAKQDKNNLTVEVEYIIPGSVGVFCFMGYKPGLLTTNEAVNAALNLSIKHSVRVAIILFYKEGTNLGGGVYAYSMGSAEQKAGEAHIAQNSLQSLYYERFARFSTTPKPLRDKYFENELVADDIFKGRRIVVPGLVGAVSKDITGKPYVVLHDIKDPNATVQCFVGKADPALRQIKRGQEVRISGVVRGMVITSVLLDNGYIEVVQPDKKDQK